MALFFLGALSEAPLGKKSFVRPLWGTLLEKKKVLFFP